MSSTIPQQLILFGPPGTSKSRKARTEKAEALGVKDKDIIPVAFHSDLSYGEFVARLLPLTKKGRIEYSVHAGPFVHALARAYAQFAVATEKSKPAANVLLLIDEINRGNCAEIFGDIFQLLDRDDDGWSSYPISISTLVNEALSCELDALKDPKTGSLPYAQLPQRIEECIKDRQLILPPNLYLIGTMNTSDESIYFMDSAFKRRWNFEFHSVGFECVPDHQRHALVTSEPRRSWSNFVDALNQFILEECTSPKLDDKLVGPWFIKAKAGPTFSLALKHPTEWRSIESQAPRVGEFNKGAEFSENFEKLLLALVEKLPPLAQTQVKNHAQYNAGNTRVFAAILCNTGSSYPFYLSKTRGFDSSSTGLVIEDFLEGLKNLKLSETDAHVIDRADIVGKLFLYLWDNVFDRDKAPLRKLLGVAHPELRTFGQFAALSDHFIEKVCARASSRLAKPASTTTENLSVNAAA